MPKLKAEEMDLNVKELEEAEYSQESFSKYDGDIPPTGTLVWARVTKMWLTENSNGDAMFKVLAVAEDNEDDLEEFDGLPVWENLSLTVGAKFKWQPFFDCFGFTIRDSKNKLWISNDDDNLGSPIEKVGTFVPGSDDAVCQILISRERFRNEWQAKASEWISADDAEEEEEEEAPPPKRSRTAKTTKAKAAPATRRTRKPDPEPEDDDEDDEEPEEEERPAPRRGRKPAAKAPARKATRRRKAADDDDDDEPPF